jgi:hypothetical protein
VSQDGASWRLTLDYSTSRALLGGHPETDGITADGKVIEVSEHRHRVELDLTRYEIGLSHTFNETWDAFLRAPYFIKDQRAEVEFDRDTPADERAAAIRNGEYHHRSATYEGWSDFELGLGWRKRGLLGEKSVFRFSLGTTLPVGEYEKDDPLRAGEDGREHLHIQFGNGTFDPLIDFYLGLPMSEKWALSLYGKGRFPLYENDAGYFPGIEAALLPRITFLPTKDLSFSTGLAANYYGYSEWNGVRDPNSGQFTLNAALGAGWKVNEHLSASVSVLLPVYTKTFIGEDSLDPSPVFSTSISWVF